MVDRLEYSIFKSPGAYSPVEIAAHVRAPGVCSRPRLKKGTELTCPAVMLKLKLNTHIQVELQLEVPRVGVSRRATAIERRAGRGAAGTRRGTDRAARAAIKGLLRGSHGRLPSLWHISPQLAAT